MDQVPGIPRATKPRRVATNSLALKTTVSPKGDKSSGENSTQRVTNDSHRGSYCGAGTRTTDVQLLHAAPVLESELQSFCFEPELGSEPKAPTRRGWCKSPTLCLLGL